LKIKITVLDDDGSSYEGECILLKTSKPSIPKSSKKPHNVILFKDGTTGAKIFELIKDSFFDTNRTITEIVQELKTYDYHYKSTDLTLPLRTLVRKNILRKTKDLPSGNNSKLWTYVRPS